MSDAPQPDDDLPTGEAESTEEDWSEADVERLRSMIGGKAGIADGAVPAVLFVTGNAIWSLTIGAIAATAYGVAVLAYRAVRRQRVRHAAIGLGALAFSVGIALLTRNPNAYFVPGAALGALTGLLYLITVAVRQPISAMLAMAVERKERAYYKLPEVHRMHMIVTSVWGLTFVARAALRSILIVNDQTELLGASAIVLGYPLTAALVGGSVVYLRRGAKRLAATAPSDPPIEP
jgi:hypothetical protein